MSLAASRVEDALRVVRALGSHRYVAGRLHLVHAFVFAAAPGGMAELDEGRAWAQATLANEALDPASRDEALWRRSTDAELAAILEVFWRPSDVAAAAHRVLRELLTRHELPLPTHSPFDEAAEDEMHPLLIDAGWELRPLRELDAVKHTGVMTAYGSALGFESACFEEETALVPSAHLYELPALGPLELLQGIGQDGRLTAPLVLWVDGDETYLDYVVRGVRRAAKLPERDPDDE